LLRSLFASVVTVVGIFVLVIGWATWKTGSIGAALTYLTLQRNVSPTPLPFVGNASI
jgi:hypothetical protein